MCNCKNLPELIDINHNYSAFKDRLEQIDMGSWCLLMQCFSCGQLYRVDVQDRLQSCYAVKIPSKENWEIFNCENLIKERIIENRGGLTESNCIWLGCNKKQVKDKVFCVDHLYSSGIRE